MTRVIGIGSAGFLCVCTLIGLPSCKTGEPQPLRDSNLMADDRHRPHQHESNCAFTKVLESSGVNVKVSVPSDEPCSIGTIQMKITFSEGRTQLLKQERDGTVENAWLVDLENDGLLDLVVTITSAGSGSYGTVTMYQKRGNQFVSRPLAPLSPPPNPDASKEYRGHDAFEVKDGHLFWSCPAWERPDGSTGGDRVSSGRGTKEAGAPGRGAGRRFASN